jgi:hypothetical protein
MGLKVRRKLSKMRIHMILDVPMIFREAARVRGISLGMLIRRWLDVISRDHLVDAVLDDNRPLVDGNTNVRRHLALSG